jgi:hypothetical protein
MYGYRPARGYVGLIIIGLIILIVGGIISVSWGYITPDYSGYSDHVRVIATTGNIIQLIGLIIFSVGIVSGSLRDDSLPTNARLGMLIAMGIILGFKFGGYILYPYFS